jgi:negative regulator of sigma E activity
MIDREESTSEFERRVRAVLSERLTRIDARTRSRLNQARHAALAAAAGSRRSAWAGPRFMPMTGAVAAAVLVALVWFNQRPQSTLSASEGSQPTLEVLDLVGDDEALSMMEDDDHSFYEWAVDQADGSGSGEASAS